MKKAILTALAALLLLPGCRERVPAYRNPALSSVRRTADLLSRMTVEEKIGQILCVPGWEMVNRTDTAVSITDAYRSFAGEQHGGMLWATFRADAWTGKDLSNGLGPVLSARAANALQRYALDSTRLGIPILLAEETPHGHMAIGGTVFPTGIGLSATWDEELMTEVGGVIARELRARGGHIGFGPVIDLSREPRWSRVEETFGEDVVLTSRLASAWMRGAAPAHVGWESGIVSTLKHFTAYGIPEGGHNGGPAQLGERELRAHFLPAFRSAVQEGALGVMTAYNSFDGEPCTGSRFLLQDVLRDEWGFDGIVISDLQAIDGLYGVHHVASSLREAGEKALLAGVDVDLGGHCFSLLKESLEAGRISMKDLDRAAGRVLKLKFDLGLFDHPYVEPSEIINSQDIALRAAREGITLLENNGILPLAPGMKVAVIGPNADAPAHQTGDYTAVQAPGSVVTPLDGIRHRAGEVRYARGCTVRGLGREGFPEALSAAAWADVIVAVVGGTSAPDAEEGMEEVDAGEGRDRSSLALPGVQEELLVALEKTGKPLVVVYIEGRPLEKNWAKTHADALLTAWYPGSEGGTALAEVLWGEVNPSGRLSISVPVSSGTLPVYYNRKRPLGGEYIDGPSEPLYEFGYGKSYTTFAYSDLRIRPGRAGEVSVSFTVTNTGSCDGDEVPQLYVSDLGGPYVAPERQLRDFCRVHVPQGASVRVEFTVQDDPDGSTGERIFRVGASSRDIRLEQRLPWPPGEGPLPCGPVPTEAQLRWQQMERNLFIHFGPNTFTGQEWGSGKEPEDVFCPTDLDCRQWARTARDAGFSGIILTAKHHDGFCLWPNPESAHTVAQSVWMDGKGDVLRDLSEACREYGLKLGLYISPWDRHDPSYGTPAYNDVFVRTLESALGGYGDIFEQWFDGANGEGPSGKRQQYDWPRFNRTVRSLQKDAVIFSDVGPGCRWCGNERGTAGRTCWSTLSPDGFAPGAAAPSQDTLQCGNVYGSSWIPAEVDVSIRPGWFWRESENDRLKSVNDLLKIFYESAGRNALLLLNVPPDIRGRIHEADSARLMAFNHALQEIFAEDLAAGARVKASSSWTGRQYRPGNLLDPSYDTFWVASGEDPAPSLTLSFAGKRSFNRVSLQEYIPLGQRIEAFAIDARSADGSWQEIARETTVGYRRIVLVPETTSDAIRIRFLRSRAAPALSRLQVFMDRIYTP